MLIRGARPPDIDAVVTIERASFADPWTAGMFVPYLWGGVNTFLVTEEEEEVAGFAIAHNVADESELLDLAVRPHSRGRGVGAALLDAIAARCAARGARSMTLEVRESNLPARALYARRGFVQIGRRRRYYHKPEEDGLVLRAVLPIPAAHLIVSQ